MRGPSLSDDDGDNNKELDDGRLGTGSADDTDVGDDMTAGGLFIVCHH
jgi:hypothetical protein